MARLNKFASVNLNDSYGKPDQQQGGSAGNNSTSSSSGKSRVSSPGGMLVLTRPGRGQPPSPKLGGGRLGIPSPVNLPSLKRENSGGETPAGSPPLAGWTKGEALAASPPLAGWTKGETPADVSNHQQKAGFGKTLDMAGEGLKAMALGKPDVYAPPALRAMQAGAGGSTPRSLPPTPVMEKQPAIIRVEEFPTLQAAIARPPTPPQHQRQKDLQQKQREKQQEVKDQHLKLQQLSQAQVQKQIQGDPSEAVAGNLQLQPALTLRPLQEQPLQKVVAASPGPDSLLYPSSMTNQIGGQGSGFGDGSLAMSTYVGMSNQASNWADDEREVGHNLRPQYRSPLPGTQGSFSTEIRQSGSQNGSDPSWLSSTRRDFLPSRNGDHAKLARDFRSPTEDLGQIESDTRRSPFNKESYFSKDPSLFREGISAGFGRVDAYVEQEGFGKEGLDSSIYGRASPPVRELVQGRDVFHGQRSFGRETYNRDPREVHNKEAREPHNRDFVDMYNKDLRDTRENYIRDTGDLYHRDVREVYNRNTRDIHTQNVREVYNKDMNINRQVGYGNFNDDGGDSLQRVNASHIDSRYGRGGFHTSGISAPYSPGSGHDTQFSRRYGSQGTRDQFLSKEGHPALDSRASCGQYVEPPVSHISAEGLGSRRMRGPAPGGTSFDSLRETHEAQFERTHKVFEEDGQIKFEDKGRQVKATGDEQQWPNYTVQDPLFKRDLSEGPAARVIHIDISRKVEDERGSREDLRKQLLLEDERRKEAARLKLIELEERIAQRTAEEGRKEEIKIKGKDDYRLLEGETHLNATLSGQEDVEQVSPNPDFEQEGKGVFVNRAVWREEDPGPKLARPSSASSSSSWTYRASGEGFVTGEQDFQLGITESELNQDQKIVRSRSPNSWRKEIGNGPTSKLFSSPYIESGGFRRLSDGGTYKLF